MVRSGADFESRSLSDSKRPFPLSPGVLVLASWICPLKANGKRSALEEKPQPKSASCEATKTKCPPASASCHPSWAITAADSSLLPACWTSSPWAGISVSCPCTGGGILPSFVLKLWIAGEWYPRLRCHGSTILGEGVDWDDCGGRSL